MSREILKPYPYQLEGARRIAKTGRALLADRMGLGKSAQAVLAADMLGALNVTVICPATVRWNWLREFERFSPMDRPAVAVSTAKDEVPPDGLVVCSYDLAAKPAVHAALLARRTDMLILDEAHYLKERDTNRTKRILLGDDGVEPLVREVKHVVCITGTPAPNDVSELWPMLAAVFPEVIDHGGKPASFSRFVKAFCRARIDRWGGLKITGNRNVPELKRRLARIMIRRSLEDVGMQLPPLRYEDVTVEQGPVDLVAFFPKLALKEARDEFHAQDNAMAAMLTTAETEDAALEMLQAANGSTSTVRRYVGLSKVQAAAEIALSELITGGVDKMVIFAIHLDVILQLQEKLKHLGSRIIFGGTSERRRNRYIDQFQNSNLLRVLICNITAAGVGITLTAANEVLFVESSFVPANNAQAAMRCHRIGQRRPVRVRFLSLANSVDEHVQKIVRRKTQQLTEVFGSAT